MKLDISFASTHQYHRAVQKKELISDLLCYIGGGCQTHPVHPASAAIKSRSKKSHFQLTAGTKHVPGVIFHDYTVTPRLPLVTACDRGEASVSILAKLVYHARNGLGESVRMQPNRVDLMANEVHSLSDRLLFAIPKSVLALWIKSMEYPY